VSGAQLQAEMERMAQTSRNPEMLQELWAALGNDPRKIAECLARPPLVEREIRNNYACDERFHGKLKEQAAKEAEGCNAVWDMKGLKGKYTEVEWKRGKSQEERDLGKGRAVDVRKITLSEDEWDKEIGRLGGIFGQSGQASSELTEGRVSGIHRRDSPDRHGQTISELPVGCVSGLQEDADRYYVLGVLDKGHDTVRVATVVWQKTPFDEWWGSVRGRYAQGVERERFTYKLPEISSSAAPSDTWSPTEEFVPSGYSSHTAVWTGTSMIVWGGQDNSGNPVNTGGRYDPATDTWLATSTTGAPSARGGHTGVWAGTRMIIWGGWNTTALLKTGGRYDPAANTWLATSTTGAPVARDSHTAVWTGTKMIVWGGWATIGRANTGGRYDPAANTWLATSTTNAPVARYLHTAVWTNTEMIVWGGEDNTGLTTNTGGRYTP